jgi:RNA polymerase sigma-70 factor (ECF subfamily)
MRDVTRYEDRELIRLIQKGDQAAFAEIYQRHWDLLYFHALKLLKNGDDAKDVLQEVFTTLWNNAASIAIHTDLKGYLFTAVRNRVLNLIRDNKVYERYLQLFAHYLDKHRVDTVEKIQEEELVAAIEQIIASLPPKMRQVFELSRNEQLSHRQIAQYLQISEGTVKRQISNALQHFRTRLDKPESLVIILSILHLTNRS